MPGNKFGFLNKVSLKLCLLANVVRFQASTLMPQHNQFSKFTYLQFKYLKKKVDMKEGDLLDTT